jgi:hypothetical protein
MGSGNLCDPKSGFLPPREFLDKQASDRQNPTLMADRHMRAALWQIPGVKPVATGIHDWHIP